MNASSPEQAAIIASTAPHLCVLASAGSGKTTVVIERVVNLIRKNAIAPSQIAIITFTNLAAEELAKRLGSKLADSGIDEPVYTGTIHSFCIKLMKEFEPHVAANFKVLTPGKQFALLYRKYNDWQLQTCLSTETRKSEIISRLIRTFDYIHLNQCDLALVQATSPEVYAAFQQYSAWCAERGYVDFSAVLARFSQKLYNTSFFSFVTAHVRYLIIDEYQDTDKVQEQIVERLAPDIPIMVVGDDDQCIYQFRGTTPANILGFKTKIAGALELPLSTNYRCGSNIVSLADAIVSRIPDRRSKPLQADWSGGVVVTNRFPDVQSEATFIANEIEKQRAAGRLIHYSDAAILFRSVSSHADAYVAALRAKNIPVIVRGDKALFERPEVQATMDLLEFISSEVLPLDRIDLLSASLGLRLSIPSRWSGPIHIDEFGPNDWYELGVPDSKNDLIEGILNVRAKYLSQKFSSLLEIVLQVGSHLKIIVPDTPELSARNFGVVTGIVKEYDEIVGGLGLRYLINYLKIFAAKTFDASDEGSTADAVFVLTVHQSKGLEFETVFLPMLVDKRFPLEDGSRPFLLDAKVFDFSSFTTKDADERRIFYVAITRAKGAIYLSGASDVGLVRAKQPSIFLTEAMPHVANGSIRKSTSSHPTEIPSSATSYSKMEYYLSCPYRYKITYVLGIETPANPFFQFGQLVHLVLRMAHESYQNSHPLSTRELLDFYDTNFPAIYSVPKLTIASMQRRGRKAIERYLSDKQPWLHSTWQTERPFLSVFELECKAGKVRVELAGQIDLIIGDKDNYEVIDFKTGKAHPYIRTELQLQLYSHALASMFGRPPSRATILYVEEGKEVSYEVSENWIQNGLNIFQDAAVNLSDSNFAPTPGSVCSRCEVKMLCIYRV